MDAEFLSNDDILITAYFKHKTTYQKLTYHKEAAK